MPAWRYRADRRRAPSRERPRRTRPLDGERGLAAIAFCGGEEKLPAGSLDEVYGRPVQDPPEDALRRFAHHAEAVVDLADEPALGPSAKLRLAALALHAAYAMRRRARARPPRYDPVAFDAPKLAVIATGKRTGKTALAGHLARLVADDDPLIVCMGLGGPAQPLLAGPDTTLDDLIALVGPALTPLRTTSRTPCWPGARRRLPARRGGLSGAPFESNVPEGPPSPPPWLPVSSSSRARARLHPAGAGRPHAVHRRSRCP